MIIKMVVLQIYVIVCRLLQSNMCQHGSSLQPVSSIHWSSTWQLIKFTSLHDSFIKWFSRCKFHIIAYQLLHQMVINMVVILIYVIACQLHQSIVINMAVIYIHIIACQLHMVILQSSCCFQIMEDRLTNGNASLNEMFHFPVIKKELSQKWVEMEDSEVK